MPDVRDVQGLPEFIYDDRINDEQPEYLRAPSLLDIIDFGNMVSRLISNMNLPSEYWRSGTRAIVTPEYPDLQTDGLVMPQIVWDVVSRTPFSTDPHPRRRNVQEFDEDRTSEAVLVHNVQRFQNTIEFLCIDRDNYHASRLQEFLEDFMELHNAIFQSAGIGDVRYDSRINDRILSYRERVNDKYAVRTTRYTVYTQIIRVLPRVRLQQIDVRASAGYYVRINEPVTRGSGSYDTLDKGTAIFITQVKDTVESIHTNYQKDVDYSLGTNNKLYWLTDGDAPTEGDIYFVSYLYGETLETTDTSSILY